MKALKLTTTILITLGVLTTGYFTFCFLTSGQEVISTGVTLAFLFLLVMVLFTFRLSLSGNNKKVSLPLIITLLLVTSIVLMYLQRQWIDSIWNYALALFVLLQGINLIRSMNSNHKIGKLIKIITALTILLILVLCVLKIGTPLLYMISTVALLVTSLGSLAMIFINKSAHHSA